MNTKRLRIFAGPNGSGKTTIIGNLRSEIPFGIYVNADDIEQQLKKSKIFLFSTYQLNISEHQLQSFFKQSTFSPLKRNEPDLWKKLKVTDNVLKINTTLDSYLSADIADFIRQELLDSNISFTYETVMSHESKILFLKKAREKQYRVYLYFVATEDPEINVSRVNIRVAQNGHFVAPATITERYFKSLSLLKSAIKASNRAYIWDNSGTTSLLIAEITDGEDVEIIDTEVVPSWFIKYVVD